MNSPVHILFIDNDPEIRELAFEALAQEFPGITFSGVNEAEGLEAALEAGGFDIVVTDYILAWTDGQAVLKRIKEIHPDCPVIVFTVTGEDQAILKAVRKGGADDPAHRWPQFLELLFVAVRAGIEKAELVRGRKQATEALRVTESRFRSVFQTASDAIVLADADGNIVDWNGAATRIFGYEETEVAGKPLTILMPERYREQYSKTIAGYRETPKGTAVGRTVEFHGRRKDGSEFPLELSIGSWEGDRGCGFSGVMRDITDRRRAEAELRRSYERLQELSARVAKIQEEERTAIARELHDELGQILTGLGFDLTRLAKHQETLDPGKRREKLEELARIVDATVSQVRRISAELRPALLDELGLRVAIESQAEAFSVRTGLRCVVRSNVNDKALPVGITAPIYRIFQECLTNIARHARAHRITVNLRQSNGSLVLEMRDDGRGISDAELEDPRSLGLRGMMERSRLIGGEVEIHGVPGQGTTVKVVVPLTPHIPQRAEEVPA